MIGFSSTLWGPTPLLPFGPGGVHGSTVTGTRPSFKMLVAQDVQRTMAVREGFEPSVAFTTPAFQASTFNHSVTSPRKPLSMLDLTLYITWFCDLRRKIIGNLNCVCLGRSTRLFSDTQKGRAFEEIKVQTVAKIVREKKKYIIPKVMRDSSLI